MGLRLLTLTGAALLGAAGSAQAGVLSAGTTSDRSCSARLLPASAPAADSVRHLPSARGLLVARLDARRGDWDLAVFDASSGRRLAASSSYGPDETATAGVRGGRPVTIQACRRTGPARRARLDLRLHPLGSRRADPVRLVAVRLSGPRDRERLEAAGFDVTHSRSPGRADVVLRSASEAARLGRLGFRFRTSAADLAVVTRRALAAHFPQRRSALPSRRTAYRTLADYAEDSKALARNHPGLVRLIEAGRSVEGRPIEGVEVAVNVERRDDGRPVLLLLGLHHAREWPSGEMPMELAIDLARGYGADPRITALLDRVRVVAVPVVNPDGFEVSRAAPAIRSLEAGGYKRKNCRPQSDADAALPCALRAEQGVDLNRNYGAYWGGPGSSGAPRSETYRGPAPFSEPEAEAVRDLMSTRNVVTVISHHTYAEEGLWLRQPGFCANPPAGCDGRDVLPDESGMRSLGDAMAEASGWRSRLGWEIGEITGAADDWSHYATGAYGFTPEQRGTGFHDAYGRAVVAEYTGSARGAAGGVREALLRAAERSADARFHSVVRGTAVPGHVLRLSKRFATPAWRPSLTVPDRVELSTLVRADGRFEWHVNPSTRPRSASVEAYGLSCESPDGAVVAVQEVVVRRGEAVEVDACRPARPRLSVGLRRLSARRLNRRGRVPLFVRADRGPVRRLRAVLAARRDRRVVARGAVAGPVSGDARLALRLTRRLRPGRHVARVAAVDGAGRRVRARRVIRVRR